MGAQAIGTCAPILAADVRRAAAVLTATIQYISPVDGVADAATLERIGELVREKKIEGIYKQMGMPIPQ